MAKILLVEDDRALSIMLREALASRMHQVDIVTDGKEALHWLQQQPYSAAIVDWELPGMTGVDLCRSYRNTGGSIPILMLTGKSALRDKVTGLDAGADDYLPKPFELEELYARLRALLRRGDKDTYTTDSLIAGEIELNTASGELTVAGQRVQVTRRELGILELLLRNPNHTIGAEAIIERVWPSDSDASPDVVRCHITRLRNKLRTISEPASESIKAVYGLGYKLEVGK